MSLYVLEARVARAFSTGMIVSQSDKLFTYARQLWRISTQAAYMKPYNILHLPALI